MIVWLSCNFLPSISFADEAGTEEQNYSNNFTDALSQSTAWIQQHIDGTVVAADKKSTTNNIIKKVTNTVFSVMIVVWVLIAMIGLYQVLTSSDESKVKSWTMTLLYGVIGIILMYSAQYLTSIIFETLFKSWVWTTISNVDLVKDIYDKIAFPFIKIAMYLSLWFLVIVMMMRVFTYITSQDEGTKKKSLGVIARTTIGMIFIIWAKQIVEAIYWQQKEVIEEGEVWTNLNNIGTNLLNPEDIPIVFNVINRALGLVAFVLLALIIMQTYKMLVKPDDAETFKSLKKTIIYALAGILLIGSAYLLANLFIIG